jgi:RNA-binding protein
MALVLTSRDRARLKARAHALEPVVHAGQSGLTDALVREVDRALTTHELIKVKVGAADRDVRAELAGALCDRTDAALVQQVGKVFVLWRPKPDEPADQS